MTSFTWGGAQTHSRRPETRIGLGPRESSQWALLCCCSPPFRSSEFRGEKPVLRTKTPEGQQAKGKAEALESASYSVPRPRFPHAQPRASTPPAASLGTYLPTINLIVFVQTPFRARAKDTATKQTQTENDPLALRPKPSPTARGLACYPTHGRANTRRLV